jgi:hypothetical protein
MIVPLLDGGENRIITKSYAIKNKKLLANAVVCISKKFITFVFKAESKNQQRHMQLKAM